MMLGSHCTLYAVDVAGLIVHYDEEGILQVDLCSMCSVLMRGFYVQADIKYTYITNVFTSDT